MKRRDARAPSQRQLKVGEELRHALAWSLERGEIRDPAVQGVPVTVTEVRVSPDLKNATAFVMPLGGGAGEDTSIIVEGLNRAAPFLRRRVGETIRLKHVPKISFIIDQSFDEAGHIDALLRDPAVARDLGPRYESGRGDEDDGA